MTDDLSDLIPKLEERRETAVCPHCGAERMVIRIMTPKATTAKVVFLSIVGTAERHLNQNHFYHSV